MPGNALHDWVGWLQHAASLAPPVDVRPAGRDQRQHDDQTHPDAQPKDYG